MKMTVQRLDWLLVLPLAAAIAMLTEFDTARDTVIEMGPWLKAGVLGSLAVILSIAVAAGSAIDRRCTEDYLFQLMANAALVAIAATMLVNLAWVIGEKAFALPELASDNLLGVLILAWVVSYYWFRARGIAR